MIDIIIHLILTILPAATPPGGDRQDQGAFAGRVGLHYLQPVLRLSPTAPQRIGVQRHHYLGLPGRDRYNLAAIAVAAPCPARQPPPPISFAGDMILFAYLFALARFFTMVGRARHRLQLRGNGAAREATFSCLAEPTLFSALIVLGRVCPIPFPFRTMLTYSLGHSLVQRRGRHASPGGGSVHRGAGR